MTELENYSVSTMASFAGHDFGDGAPVRIDQDRINQFADATGDHQWIHVDEEKAKALSPFGTTIAHGFLTLSILAADVGNLGLVPKDAKAVLNYGVEKARFLAPVMSGAVVTPHYTLVSVEEKSPGNHLATIEATLTVNGESKPAVVASLLAMIVA